jgi:hypothetical protein
MENKEFYSVFPDFRFEVFEKPLELISHSNVIRMNSLNTVIANVIERSKLGEAGFAKHDIFSSPALVEKVCSDDILSPICDVSNDVCDPCSFKIPIKIVEHVLNNRYLGMELSIPAIICSLYMNYASCSSVQVFLQVKLRGSYFLCH